MNWDNIYLKLNEKGFNPAESNSDIVDFFVKITDEKKMYICVLLKCLEGVTVTADSISKSAKRLENKFLIGGYSDVKVMHIIFADRDMSVSELVSEENNNFWIVDVVNHRVMVYENQPEDYFGMRDIIENEIKDATLYDIKDERKVSLTLPMVTAAIALINIIIFIIGEFNLFGVTGDEIFDWGCLDYNSIYNHGEYYRILSSMFLHAGYEHIVSNMFILLAIGIGLKTEKEIGHIQFLLIYLVSGIGAGVVSSTYHLMMRDDVVSVGASGAIYGLFGLIIVSMIMSGKFREEGRRIIIMIVLLVVGSINEQIDMAAHMGGLLVGTIISLGVLRRRESEDEG
ncbi:MAG: rhomboid family intramembrane serine protease [Lachnospiraceae bacterium]|nr:rhomboid family intramembrane serine protease [Lachnospiraceae bacterium]